MEMKKVFIDPGHGGKDAGAVSGSILEKEINWKVAVNLAQMLTEAGYRVLMSRMSDEYKSLADRCKLANDWKADLFISVHHNAGGGDGFEVIHSIFHGVGYKVAKLIGEQFTFLGQNPHGTHPIYDKEGSHGDYFAVIRDTDMPAVISEYAFIDTDDRNAVDTDEELMMEARAITTAVIKSGL